MPTPERFVIESLFRVVDKEQNDVDFILNSAQRAIDDAFTQRIIIPKARQEGVSTYFLARSAVRCLGRKNTRAVIISHDTESTERMLLKVKYFLETMKGPKPIIKNNNRNEITFPKTNSMLYIGTAGSRAFGRGDTITDLHCSEVPYWPNPQKLMSGLLQAVPKSTGCISIESTGNGSGDWFHTQCMRSLTGDSTFKLVFLPWHTFEEYQVPMTPDECMDFMCSLRDGLEERKLLSHYGLTPQQLAWRRIVIGDELDGSMYEWNKEYPTCMDDCFQVAEGGIFQHVNYVPTNDWMQVDANTHILAGHPAADLHYIIGGDVGAGVGQDASVAEVFCIETDEQVGEYINNKIEPDMFAYKLADLGRTFNMAYIGCEANNHGILTLKTLTQWDHDTASMRYDTSRIYRTSRRRKTPGAPDQVRSLIDIGVRTTARSKPLIIGTLRTAIKESVIIHSIILKNELSTFIEMPDGSMGADSGCHDDTVMAAGMAFFVKNKGALTLIQEPITKSDFADSDPFSLNSIIKEMTSSHKKIFPTYITGGRL